jgi:hypothetical protein
LVITNMHFPEYMSREELYWNCFAVRFRQSQFVKTQLMVLRIFIIEVLLFHFV